MAIIQKMILTLLAVTLLPIFLIGSVFYLSVQSSQRGQVLGQLTAIATIQQNRIEALIKENQETLDSFTSRQSILTGLNNYDQSHKAADQASLQQSLVLAQARTTGSIAIAVLDPAGQVVASTPAGAMNQSYSAQVFLRQGLAGDNVTSDVFRNGEGKTNIDLVGPLKLAGRTVGVAVIEYDAADLWTIAEDQTGLGATGETVLVKRDTQGQALYLAPLRFDSQAVLQPVAGAGMQKLAMAALGKDQTTFTDASDYRGHAVLVATRYIPAADWGLVIKIDRTEAYQPLAQLGDLLLTTIFILSVIIIFIAFYLARSLNEPILMLAATADKIRAGDLSQRAPVGGKDEIGQLAAAFNAMASELEKIDQMKSEFVLLTSHQLRTPATAVKGFIAMLLDGYAGAITPQQKKLAKAAYAENERQISVINSILDVARLEAGELELVMATHDMRRIIEASAAGQAPLLAAQGQTIEVEKPKQPVNIMVDAEKFQLVIDNLIHNAIKYSPRGTKITASVEKQSKSVVIRVKDQGIGIAAKDIPRLFKRFSRISGPETANIQGAGLGLYLANKLVAMHGGKISIQSQVGKGTTFTIDLPNTREKGEQ